MSTAMNLIKKCLLFFIPTIIVVTGLEIGARILIWDDEDEKYDYFSDYSVKELDTSIPFIHSVNGGSCVSLRGGFNWSQWWGFNAKLIDFGCIKEHFSDQYYNVVFMGGSAMYSSAPNYLTTIDYLTLQQLDGVRSINLAESGARHMNMSVRFQRQVIPLEPDLVIFFDGYNEFNSISFGGAPEDDFYWTASGYDRMHKPHKLFLSKAIELSAFLELALVRTRFYKSARNVTDVLITESDLNASAFQYLEDIKNTKALCDYHDIRCLFIIQPHVYGSEINQHRHIIQKALEEMPYVEEMRVKGYEIIIKNCEFCIDMSNILHNQLNTFNDPVHFEKRQFFDSTTI